MPPPPVLKPKRKIPAVNSETNDTHKDAPSDATTLAPATPSAGSGQQSGMGSLAASIGVRNLWIIILAMPAVFLVVVAAIIAIFGKPRSEPKTELPPIEAVELEARPNSDASGEVSVEVTNPSVGTAPITIPRDAAAGSIALDGDRLAIRVDGPAGVVIVVYDLAKGEVIARVPVRAED